MLDDGPTSKTARGPDAPLPDLLLHPACLVDAAGGAQHLNAAWRRLAGVDGTPRLWLTLLDAQDRDAAAARLRAAAASRTPASFACRLTVSGQSEGRWHQLALQPAEGGWLCQALDIHALKSEQQKLSDRASAQARMLDAGLDCVKLLAPDGRLLHANRAGCAALGLPDGGPFGMPWLDLLPPEIGPAGRVALADALAGQPARFPGRSELPGEPTAHWDNMLTPLLDAQGRTTAILCVSREVTAERAAQESLRRSQQRLVMAAGVAGLGVWDYDIPNDVMDCDETWHHIMGRDPATPVRCVADFRPLIHPEDVDRATEVDETAAQLLAAHGHYKIEFRIVHAGGEVRWVRSAATLLYDAGGRPARAVGFVLDITDARRGEMALHDSQRTLIQEKEALERQSLEDPLTGLTNRRGLDAALEQTCADAAARGEVLALAMLDVDYFKAYNDRYGHLQGDDALRAVAAALQSIARRTDVVARYGGEEFVLLLPGMEDPAPVLQRLQAAVEALGMPHGASPLGRLSVSCGCVVFPRDAGLTPTDMLAASDAALYAAKSGGRNRHVLRVHAPQG